MFLVELVMQGVRGFQALVRLRFQGGFNLIAAGNEAGKTTAVETVQRLLFPRNEAGLLDTLLSRQTPDASRGALVVFSDDGGYYRIIEDFSKRAANLSKYDAGTKDFTLMQKEWDSAAAFMSRLMSNTAEQDFEKVFIFRREHYANLRGASGPAAMPAPIPRAQPSKPAAPAAHKTGSNDAKLAELREALQKSEEAADAEYKAQSAKLALDEVRKKLASLEEIEQKRHDISAKLAELKGCENLPEDLHSLLEAYERLQGQKSAEVEDLNSQLSGLKAQLDTLPTVDLMKDKFLLAGGVLGAISFILGMFVFSSAQRMYFYGGLVAAMGLMGFAVFNSTRSSGKRKTLEQEIETLEKDRNGIDKRPDKESVAMKALMKSACAATPAELKDKADSYRYLHSLQDDIEDQWKRITADRNPEMLQQEYNRLQQEALELGKAARAVAQYNIDTYAIRQEIERIEGEASSVASGGVAWDFGAEPQDLPTDFGAAPSAGRGQAGFHAELEVAARIGGIELETLIPAVEAGAQRNLAAITNGKYLRIEVGQAGGAPRVHARDEAITQYADLSHGTQDLIYFCLRTGLVEALAGKVRLPMLLDDALAGFDVARQKAACQVLRTLGTKTQVILFSSNPALKAEGDAYAELQ
jgi:hypothetical protein